MFGALSKLAPARTAKLGYWLFRHPSAVNYATPEEKALVEEMAGVFSDADQMAHDGLAGCTPLWRWPGSLDDTTATQPTVLLLHGWGGEAGLMGGFVAPLLERGYRVLIPDLPGHGTAEGRLVDTRMSASTVVELGKSHGPFHAIVGHSLGGLLGCMAAAGHPVIGGRVEVQRLVTINSPVSLGAVIDGLGGAIGLAPGVITSVTAMAEHDLGFPVTEVHAQTLLERANLPALAFHDTDDPFIPHAGSLARLAQHAGLEARETSGLGHISVLQDRSVLGQVADFLGPAG